MTAGLGHGRGLESLPEDGGMSGIPFGQMRRGSLPVLEEIFAGGRSRAVLKIQVFRSREDIFGRSKTIRGRREQGAPFSRI